MLVVAAFAFLLAAEHAYASEAVSTREPELYVHYEENLLTVRCRDAPTSTVLEELREQSGAEFDTERLEDQLLTLDFSRMPLHEALRRVMPRQNYLATYKAVSRSTPDGLTMRTTLARLEVTGHAGVHAPVESRTDAPDGESQIAAQSSREATLAARALYGSVLSLPADVESDGRLKDAIPSDGASVFDVFDAAFANPDAEVREEAAAALARILEAHAGEVALPAGDKRSATQMASVLRQVAGGNAEEFLAVLLRSLQDPHLRSQAEAIREALH